ncbi:BA75_03587T0 [Komagataella pastoris]|uniref:Amine oxidase n=1 Tax=Komagataella pastoris TaxID=4922 RepID=A0A1B2JGA2_PICPA|nr:BA75_03587T0 [Komagataella pastoris]
MNIGIIGGGISGLKCAQVLNDHGLKVEILEARNRLGGRIRTHRDGIHGIPYDLGASWFHDTLTNELFDQVIAEKKDGKNHELVYDDGKPLYVTEDEGVLDYDYEKLEQVKAEACKYIELRYFENLNLIDVPLKDTVQSYLARQEGLLTEKQQLYVGQMLRDLELWHGVSWDEMSSKYALVDNVGRNCYNKSGYDQVIDSLRSSIPESSVLLECVVNRIERGGKKVKVHSNEGVKKYDFVIVTVPQSILQLGPNEEGSILWEPSLPELLKHSLEKIHFGFLGKFVFEFDQLYWDKSIPDRVISIATPGKELRSDAIPETWEFPVLFLNLHRMFGKPALLAFTQGNLTKHLESFPELAWNYFKPIWRKVCQKDIPDPVNVVGSNWSVDPFSRGSYSACLAGDDPTDPIIQLSKGLDNVRFAGEHTIFDGAGAAHGAWLSGQREANYVLRKLDLISKSDQDDDW